MRDKSNKHTFDNFNDNVSSICHSYIFSNGNIALQRSKLFSFPSANTPHTPTTTLNITMNDEKFNLAIRWKKNALCCQRLISYEAYSNDNCLVLKYRLPHQYKPPEFVNDNISNYNIHYIQGELITTTTMKIPNFSF